MKANELMIGDWVIVHHPTMPAERIQISADWIKTIERINNGLIKEDSPLFRIVEPIPLTGEILEKNGFTRFGTNYILKGGHFGLDNPSNPSNYLDNYWLRISIKAVHIEYVHELQHALRLCGIEKEIGL